MDLKDFRVDALLNLYLLGIKDVNCYATPSVKGAVWFKKKNGEILGKLYSWIENDEGVFMMFKVNDNFDAHGANTSYYIPLEPKMMNWDYVKRQLDAIRRSQMSWYEKWFDDLETAISNYKKELAESTKSGLKWGAGILGAVILGTAYYNLVFKPNMQARVYKSVIKSAIKEYKK